MPIASRMLASGSGWQVRDVVCELGPHDPTRVEQHDFVSLAVVARGSFQYRTSQGAALLGPGSVLLGNHGACFECGHDHAYGDRCLAFHFSPEFFESVAAAVPGARRATFQVPRIPPDARLAKTIAAAESARDLGDAVAFEELAVDMAGSVLQLLVDAGSRTAHRVRGGDERRISDVVRAIETALYRAEGEELSLATLAARAALSPYHFLRVFRSVVGMTPHQFILNRRLHRAAVNLRTSGAPIADVAFDAGFGDLSTFNRRFRQVMGAPPGEYRASKSAAR